MTGPAGDELAAYASERFSAVVTIEMWLRRRARRTWQRLRPDALQASFVSDVLPTLAADLSVAQAAAAGASARLVASAGVTADLVPAAFAEAAPDGQSIPSLLSQPVIRTYQALGSGSSTPIALTVGMDAMDRILSTTIQDVARQAEHVAIVADRAITYWIRMTEPGACGRCIILSGNRYRWSQGFLRHPQCRCSMAPDTIVDQSQIRSPRELYDEMSPEERTAAFGAANAKAIADGADIGRVVNATGRTSGMTSLVDTPEGRLRVTTERNPDARGRARRSIRPTPEGIYRLAGDDRAEAIRLLKLHGYVR